MGDRPFPSMAMELLGRCKDKYFALLFSPCNNCYHQDPLFELYCYTADQLPITS